MSPSVKISAVEGNRQALDGGSMFGNAPRPVWERWIKPDELGRIPLACRALLIEFGETKILCETGIGAFFEPSLAERYGVQEPDKHQLLESLKELDLSHEDIDYVILSHLHFDHAGGLLPSYEEQQKGHRDLLFPKARYIVGQEAFERATNPHSRDRASFIPDLTQKLKDSGRLLIVDKPLDLPELDHRLEFFISNGHTPGQMHTVFRGNEHKILFAGDLIPGTPWVHLPITMGYDRYPEKLIDEKEELYKKAVPEEWLVFFTHDPKISASYIEKNEKGKFAAKEPYEKLVRVEV